MREDEFVLTNLQGVSVVSVLRVEGLDDAPTHVYELHGDGVVLGTFSTLKDAFSYLNTEGF